ncbi:MAG: Rab family GTPase [Candidatus Hodarchaeota archaeon]
MTKKIVFFGPPAVGKTSMRKFFFEGIPADSLLESSELPTRGMKFNRYDYIYSHPINKEGEVSEKVPMELSVVDTSGQEMETWLTFSKEKVFAKADIIIFVFDISEWKDEMRKQYILDLISFVFNAKNELCADSEFYILANKYDKVLDDGIDKEELKLTAQKDIKEYLLKKDQIETDADVVITSLEKDFRKETFQILMKIVAKSVSPIP